MNNIGHSYLFKGDYEDARTYFSQALTLREKLNVPTDVADTLHNLAETSTKLGQYEPALDQYLKALDLRRAREISTGAAIESSGMGILFGYQGRYGAALSSQQDALKAMRDLQETGSGWSRFSRIMAARLPRSDAPRNRERIWTKRSTTLGRLKNDAKIAQALSDEGDSYFYQGDYKAAAPLVRPGAAGSRADHRSRLILITKVNQAKLAVKQGGAQSAANTLHALSDAADTLGLKYVFGGMLGVSWRSADTKPRVTRKRSRFCRRAQSQRQAWIELFACAKPLPARARSSTFG